MGESTKSADLLAAMYSNHAAPDQLPQPQGHSNDHNRAVTVQRMPDGSYQTRTEGVTQGNYAEAVKSASDPWDWARDSRTRQPLTADQVKEDSIVSVGGAEMTLADAYAHGFLKRPQQGGAPVANTPQGVAQEAQQEAERAEEVHPDLQTEAVDMRTERTFTEIVEATSAGSQIAAVQEIATEGDVSTRLLNELASQMRIEPSKLQENINSMRDSFEAQANGAAEAYGVDAEAVWEWAREAKPRELQAAIQRHLTLRNTQGYRALAKEFVENLDTIAPDMLLGSEVNGGKVERIGGRVVLTMTDGRRMTWAEALALGVMKLERLKR